MDFLKLHIGETHILYILVLPDSSYRRVLIIKKFLMNYFSTVMVWTPHHSEVSGSISCHHGWKVWAPYTYKTHTATKAPLSPPPPWLHGPRIPSSPQSTASAASPVSLCHCLIRTWLSFTCPMQASHNCWCLIVLAEGGTQLPTSPPLWFLSSGYGAPGCEAAPPSPAPVKVLSGLQLQGWSGDAPGPQAVLTRCLPQSQFFLLLMNMTWICARLGSGPQRGQPHPRDLSTKLTGTGVFPATYVYWKWRCPEHAHMRISGDPTL